MRCRRQWRRGAEDQADAKRAKREARSTQKHDRIPAMPMLSPILLKCFRDDPSSPPLHFFMAAARKDSDSSDSDPDPEVPFEEALEELESIVEEMESNELALDQLIKNYERGNQLLKSCQSRIDEAEQRIERIASSVSSQNARLESFEPESVEPASAAAAEPEPERKPKPKSKSRKSTSAAEFPDQDEEIRLF